MKQPHLADLEADLRRLQKAAVHLIFLLQSLAVITPAHADHLAQILTGDDPPTPPTPPTNPSKLPPTTH